MYKKRGVWWVAIPQALRGGGGLIILSLPMERHQAIIYSSIYPLIYYLLYYLHIIYFYLRSIYRRRRGGPVRDKVGEAG